MIEFFKNWDSRAIHWSDEVEVSFPRIYLNVSCNVGIRFYTARPMLNNGTVNTFAREIKENFEFMSADHVPIRMWL